MTDRHEARVCSNRYIEESRGPVRAILVADSYGFTEKAVHAMLAAIEGRCAQLTLTAVAPNRHPLLWLAPLTGVDPIGERDAAVALACRTAHGTVSMIPDGLPVRHCAAASWAGLLRLLGSEAYDVLLLGTLPPGRRQRRALLGMVERCGTQLVLAPER